MNNEPNDRVCTCPNGVTGMDVNCERCGLPTVTAAPATHGPEQAQPVEQGVLVCPQCKGFLNSEGKCVYHGEKVDPLLDKYAQSQAAYEWLLQDKNNVIAAQALEIAALKLQLSDSDLAFNHANEVVGKLEQDNAQKDARIAELEGGK